MPDVVTQDYPDCPHLVRNGKYGLCRVVANQTGGICGNVASNVCNYMCRLRGGPYMGREIGDRLEAMFAAEIFMLKMVNYRRNFLDRVMGHYALALDIVYPKVQWEAIQQALQPFIDAGRVGKIYLTGSLLVRRTFYKDFDIVLEVADWSEVANLRAHLPKTVLGTDCDYFFTVKGVLHNRMFNILDPVAKIFYYSTWYAAKVERCDPSITISRRECFGIAKYLRKELLQRA